MPIEDFTNDELRNEIKKREVAATKPEAISVKDISPQDLEGLRETLQEYINCLASNARYKDIKYYIYERCIDMFFDTSAWDWISERSK